MKLRHNESGHGRRRAAGTALTALVLIAVLLANVAVSLLSERYLFQVDETINMYQPADRYADLSMYTVTDNLIDLLEESAIPMVDQINAERATRGEEPITVNIIFCDDRDRVHASTYSRYILYTALRLQNAFPDHIKVSFINAEKNPSAVQRYKITSSSRIYPSQVIFEFGTEFRVLSQPGFFISNGDGSDPWAYNGEKAFANAILGVTRAEAPIACFITNHGERTRDCTSFRHLVSRAGYIVQDIDLERDDIPENCRLLISYDPQTDFYAFGNLGEAGISEIEKLDNYLDLCYSFMIFVDDETPVLPNLEEYLEEWGVTVSRGQTADGEILNYHMQDPVQRLDIQGNALLATYATTGPGASLTSDMRSLAYPAKVVFPNATAIGMSDSFAYRYETDSDTSETYRYGYYYRNGISRYLGDVFLASENAVAQVNGETYEIYTTNHPFKLMTISMENRSVQETNYLSTEDRSYVCVFSSTEFASNEVLDSAAYGNANVLLATLNTVGREVVPANINFKAFKDYEIAESALDAADALTTVILMAAIPAVACFITGAVIHVKRKYR